MDFHKLRRFIDSTMRMSHVYQPAMIKTLLEAGGEASISDIARQLLQYDQSQIEYYERITSNMPGRVLKSHGVVSRIGKSYRLNLDRPLSAEERQELIDLCDRKIREFIDRRGSKIWDHRGPNQAPVAGSLRYRVLKRASYRCELCGVSADEKALDVDHIRPRAKGGSNDVANLQALCYKCNRQKRDRDDTDFREVRESGASEYGCPFCVPDEDRIVARNADAYAMRDLYPVTRFHTLVIPVRHIPSYFDLNLWEQRVCMKLVADIRDQLRDEDGSIKGFNVGFNDGRAAGQTVFHCHIHVIPRREGDADDPRGGVRHAIPGRGYYHHREPN